MQKFSPDYKGNSHPIRQRLKAIWHILFDRNFILITGIRQFIKEGQNCRRLEVIRRTDYGGESDYLSCLGGAELSKSE